MSHSHATTKTCHWWKFSPGMQVKYKVYKLNSTRGILSGGADIPFCVCVCIYSCMPGESYHRWLRSTLLCQCQGVTPSSWFCASALGLFLFQTVTPHPLRLSFVSLCLTTFLHCVGGRGGGWGCVLKTPNGLTLATPKDFIQHSQGLYRPPSNDLCLYFLHHYILLLLSLDAHNHVDDYSGTLGVFAKKKRKKEVHISALVTSP